MHFNSLKEFIEMGGHGFYVWLSYGVALTALVFYYIFSNRQSQSNMAQLKKFYTRIGTQKKTESGLDNNLNIDETSENSKVEGN